MSKPFIPDNFNVPLSFDTEHFHLEMLAPAVAKKDYKAVMSSRERLRHVFNEQTDWPKDNMSLADNIEDLKRHRDDFLTGKAFAYTVLTLDKKQCIGCVYIDPCNRDEFDSEIYLWVTDECVHLDKVLYQTIQDWLVECWPFKKIAFPGREFRWELWHSIT